MQRALFFNIFDSSLNKISVLIFVSASMLAWAIDIYTKGKYVNF